jgi:phosphoglycerate-specific signal transduction histidine kinase
VPVRIDRKSSASSSAPPTQALDQSLLLSDALFRLGNVSIHLGKVGTFVNPMSGLTEGVRELHIGTESAEEEGVRIGVRDTGPGLSAENLERLFEPFYTTKPNGMGMGLSICRSIIEDHGGRLWATGLHPLGALFQFTIPAR